MNNYNSNNNDSEEILEAGLDELLGAAEVGLQLMAVSDVEGDATDDDLSQVSKDEMAPELTPETEARAWTKINRNKFKAEIVEDNNWIEHVEDLRN